MAHGRWLSDEERQKIITMRQQGVPVAAISAEVKRSTNFIYRILRKTKKAQQSPEDTNTLSVTTTKKQKTAVSATADTTAPAARDTSCSAFSEETGDLIPLQISSDNQLSGLSESSAALLCAVESMEVSCEPMTFHQQGVGLGQVCPGVLSARVGFAADAPASACNNVAKPTAQSGEELLHAPETTESSARPTNTSTVQPTVDVAGDVGASRAVELQQNQIQPTNTPILPLQISTRQDDSIRSISAPSLSLLAMPNQLQSSHSLRNETESAEESSDGLLERIQDEIHRLEASKSDMYDVQLLQVLVKFQAEVRLVQLQKNAAARGKRARAEEDDDIGTERLLQERLAKEIAILNVQANREMLELHREQIKLQMALILCRKQLQEANVSPTEVDRLFPQLN